MLIVIGGIPILNRPALEHFQADYPYPALAK